MPFNVLCGFFIVILLLTIKTTLRDIRDELRKMNQERDGRWPT